MKKYSNTNRRIKVLPGFPHSSSTLARVIDTARKIILCLALLSSPMAMAQSLSNTDQAAFLTAVANQDIDAITPLLDKGASSNTLMFSAISSLNMEMLNLAINAGVDINTMGADGNNALHVLASMKFSEAATLRRENNLPSEQISAHVQSRSTRLDMVDLLVTEGANINALSEQGDTPISLAFAANQALLVDYFIAKKADASIGPNLFQKAGAHIFDVSYLTFLLDYGYKATPGKNDTTTPLHVLAKHSSDKAKMALFIDNGADVNATDATGNTPLTSSVSASNPNQDNAREALVSLGAKVPANYEKMRQQSTLSKLIDDRDHVAVLNLIKQFPETINGIDQDGQTPLIRASQGSLKITRLLLDNSADINLRVNQTSALDAATASGHDYIARYLVKEGIDVN